MVFYLSIVLYITSVIIGLVLMITGKGFRFKRFLLLAGIHAALFLLYLISTRASETTADGIPEHHFTFLLFICSGTALSGLVWRIGVPWILRIYLSIFSLTFPLFLFSPSMLVNFLLTTHYSDTLGKTFCVKGQYFLERQQAWMESSAPSTYKLVERKGIFRKNIARQLDFGGTLDSIRTLEFHPDSIAVVRGYRFTETYVSSRTDSMDVQIDLHRKTNQQIERRLTP